MKSQNLNIYKNKQSNTFRNCQEHGIGESLRLCISEVKGVSKKEIKENLSARNKPRRYIRGC